MHVATSHVPIERIDSILKVWWVLRLDTSSFFVLPEHTRYLDAVFVVTEMRLSVYHTRDALSIQFFSDIFLHVCVIHVSFDSFLLQHFNLPHPMVLSSAMPVECIRKSS